MRFRAARLTNNTIDLYQEPGDGAVGGCAGPVQGRGVGSDAGERHVGRVGDVDTQHADEFGDGLPEGLPGTADEPRGGRGVSDCLPARLLSYAALASWSEGAKTHQKAAAPVSSMLAWLDTSTSRLVVVLVVMAVAAAAYEA